MGQGNDCERLGRQKAEGRRQKITGAQVDRRSKLGGSAGWRDWKGDQKVGAKESGPFPLE